MRTPKATILVVDDDPAIRDIVRQVLEHLEYSVMVAENGDEGLRMLARHEGQIDLMLLDLVMPVLDGHQTYIQLRERNRSLPVVISSGSITPQLSLAMKSDQHTSLLPKPYRASELAESVSAALALQAA